MPRTGRSEVFTRWVLVALCGVVVGSCARIGKQSGAERRAAFASGWVPAASQEDAARQRREYAAGGPKSVFELQPYRESRTVPLPGAGTATLINLNPNVNAWFLLRLARTDDGGTADYHLESADPSQRLQVDPRYGSGLVIASGGQSVPCDLWSGEPDSALSRARRSGQSFAPLCGDRLFLRLATRGRRTYKEWAADFLRDHVWRGDAITGFVKGGILRDTALATSEPQPAVAEGARADAAPPDALVDARFAESALAPGELGLRVDGRDDGLAIGRWYPLHGNAGMFASVIQPRFVSPSIRAVRPLDAIEDGALVYSVAFDLARFDLGFALGTDHPRVDWSPRPVAAQQDSRLPGPDGIGTTAPLVRTGRLNRVDTARVAATFVGGFKRIHGAFRFGPLANANHGSHYGFVEQGVIFSKLQPGLATVVVDVDGRIDLRTWSVEDDAQLPRVRFARQNGVAIVESDRDTGATRPGAFVGEWGPGNWSGSADEKLRTVRGGLCLVDADDRRFLVYSYFSSATPSAMARVFQGYGCRYAMLLDMNALEHTYLAVYETEGAKVLTQHLVEGMSVLDQSGPSGYLPRFVGLADNRDFFYLLRRVR
jgi:hypothetical protein